ncbi:MAG: insulinase family protein, partial [bacterium]
MRLLPLLFLLLLTSGAMAASPATGFAAYPEGIYVGRIGSARIPVILKPNTTNPVVEVQMWVHAGSRYEAPQVRGISHYLEHLFYRGTDKRGPLENRLEILDVGGITTAGTWYDWTYYRNKVRASDLERGIDTLTDSLMHLTLLPESVENERSVVGSEIRLRDDDPQTYAWEETMAMLFPGHPYGERVVGTFETVGQITQADFRQYYEGHYDADDIVLVIVGDFDPTNATQLLEDRLGTFERTAANFPGATPEALPAIQTGGATVALRTKERAEPLVAIGFRLPGFASPMRPSLELLFHLLADREDSLLNDLRQDGVVTQIYAETTMLEQGGSFVIYGTPSENVTVEALTDQILAICATGVESIAPEFLEASRRALVQADRRGKSTTDQQAYQLGEAWTYGDFDSYWDHETALASLTQDDVAAAAHMLFVQDNASELIVASEGWYAESVNPEAPLELLLHACLEHGLPQAAPPEAPRHPVATYEPAAIDALPLIDRAQIALEVTSFGDQMIVFRDVPGAVETAITACFTEGTAAEELPGLTDLTLQLLVYGGSEPVRKDMLAELTAMGGTIEITADRLESRITLTVPSEHAKSGADFLARILHPSMEQFNDDAIAVALATQRSDQQNVANDIRACATQRCWELAFDGSPLAHHPKGGGATGPATDAPAAPSTEAVRDSYSALHLGQAGFVVSGSCDPDDVGPTLVGALPAGYPSLALRSPVATGTAIPGRTDVPIDRSQAAVYLEGRGDIIGCDGPDYAAAQILARGLGLRNFRDLIYARGLAYSSSAQLLDGADTGAIALYAYVDPLRAAEAREALRDKVTDVLANGFPPEELANVKGWWLGSLAVNSESQSGMANRIGSYLDRGLGYDYQTRFEAALSAVTNEDVMRV